MNKIQWLALGGVGALLVAAFAFGQRGPDQANITAAPELVSLRAAAALDPCPAGLGQQLPALVLPCLGGGRAVELRAAGPGRPTLVNVWATWCAPCRDEVPELVAFHAKAGEGVGLVGVLTSDTERNGLEFSRQFGITYPSLVDDDGEVRRMNGIAIPQTLFLDAEGRVVFVQRGPFGDLAELEALVARHLGVRP